MNPGPPDLKFEVLAASTYLKSNVLLLERPNTDCIRLSSHCTEELTIPDRASVPTYER